LTNLETWVSLASIGMVVMFVLLLASFSTFLVGPNEKGPDIYVQPPGVVVQIVSISGAPGIILAGVAYGLARNYGSKSSGTILVITGAIMIAGMIYIGTISPRIPEIYRVPYFEVVRYAFIIAGIGTIAVGFILLKKPRNRRINMTDENIW
jgi:hypothetical protein